MLDIAKLEQARRDHETPARLEILDADGEPYAVAEGEEPPHIMILGMDSESVREATRLVFSRLAAEAQASGVEDEDALEGIVLREYLTRKSERITKAVAGCVGWGGFYEDGEDMEFTEENLRRVLSFDHILGQVERGMRAHKDFLNGPSSN